MEDEIKVKKIGELRKRFEQEKKENWWTNPISHGEIAYASWGYQQWLEEMIINRSDSSVKIEAEVKPATCEHNYQIARKDYYKPDGGQNSFGITYDQTKTFSTLFCTKCGETKEIISSS